MSTLQWIGFLMGLGSIVIAIHSAFLSFFYLVVLARRKPQTARRWVNRICWTSAALAFVIASTETLPTPVILVSLACHGAMIWSSSILPANSQRQSSFISSAKLVGILALRSTTYILVVRYISALNTAWHKYRTAPLLPGGRRDWDIAEPTRLEFNGLENAALMLILPVLTPALLEMAVVLSHFDTIADSDALPMAIVSQFFGRMTTGSGAEDDRSLHNE